jgi:hypothetical protein
MQWILKRRNNQQSNSGWPEKASRAHLCAVNPHPASLP